MTSFLNSILLAESTHITSLPVHWFDYVDLRLLLHTETPDGSVIPIWEEVRPGNVAVMKDVMSACKASCDDVDVFYRRVPLTAERPPDFSDYSELISVMLGPNMTHTPIVVNDQLGRGRSTLTTVCMEWRKFPHTNLRWGFYQIILILLQHWLASPVPSSPRINRRRLSVLAPGSAPDVQSSDPPLRRQSYPVINSMLHCASPHLFPLSVYFPRSTPCHTQRPRGQVGCG
jgi:hypothetical protein